jgi:hypothetical protein
MEQTTYQEVLDFLKENDIFEDLSTYNEVQLSAEYKEALKNFFNPPKVERQAVLGIDIYRYSKFPITQQNYIPFIFKHLYERTIKICTDHLSYFFQRYSQEQFKECLIPTGDGGFVILCTPLHCLLFAITFEMSLHSYNSFSVFQRLRQFTGEISLRYAITYDDLYKFEDNYYGTALIDCARILSKDRLNRCLYDANVNNWFLSRLGGVETLQILTTQRISQLPDFSDYDESKLNDVLLLSNKEGAISAFRTVISSKIGTITSKDTNLDLYNLFVQIAIAESADEKPEFKKPYIVSIGNQNSSGLEIE